jgi:hypothetical protein
VDGTIYRSPTPPTEEALITATATIAHEARHAHQWFSMARYVAGGPDKPTAREIGTAVEIPARVARRAHQQPLADGQQGYAKAKRWYLRSLITAQVAMNFAQGELDRAVTDADRKAAQTKLDAAQREYARWYALYEQLPTEADAASVEE